MITLVDGTATFRDMAGTIKAAKSNLNAIYSLGTKPGEGLNPGSPAGPNSTGNIAVGPDRCIYFTTSNAERTIAELFARSRKTGQTSRCCTAFAERTEEEIKVAFGTFPVSPPFKGSDGSIYGVTSMCVNQQYGVIYRITCMNYSALHRFRVEFTEALGTYAGALVAGPSNTFYGTTSKGGLGFGTVYQLGGTTETRDLPRLGTATVVDALSPTTGVDALAPIQPQIRVLHKFSTAVGPLSLTLGKDGIVYGTTVAGGRRDVTWLDRLTAVPGESAASVTYDVSWCCGAQDSAFLMLNGGENALCYNGQVFRRFPWKLN